MTAFVYTAIRLFSHFVSQTYVNPARSWGTNIIGGGGGGTLWLYIFGSPLGALVATATFIYLNKKTMMPDSSVLDDL